MGISPPSNLDPGNTAHNTTPFLPARTLSSISERLPNVCDIDYSSSFTSSLFPSAAVLNLHTVLDNCAILPRMTSNCTHRDTKQRHRVQESLRILIAKTVHPRQVETSVLGFTPSRLSIGIIDIPRFRALIDSHFMSTFIDTNGSHWR